MSNIYGFSEASGATTSNDSELNSYVTLDTDQVITGSKTFDNVSTFNDYTTFQDSVEMTFTASVAGLLALSDNLQLNGANGTTIYSTSMNQNIIIQGPGDGNLTVPTTGVLISVNGGASGTAIGVVPTGPTSAQINLNSPTIMNGTLNSNVVMPVASDSSTTIPTTAWVQSAIINRVTYLEYTSTVIGGFSTYGPLYFPANLKSALFTVTGGGGGAGACSDLSCVNGAGGGGAGSFTLLFYPNSGMNNLSFTLYVAGPGAGGVLPNGNGGAGSDTTLFINYSSPYYTNLSVVPNTFVAKGGGGGFGGVGGAGGAAGGSSTSTGMPFVVNQGGSTGSPYNAINKYQGNHYANFPWGSGGPGNNYTQWGNSGLSGAVTITYTY